MNKETFEQQGLNKQGCKYMSEPSRGMAPIRDGSLNLSLFREDLRLHFETTTDTIGRMIMRTGIGKSCIQRLKTEGISLENFYLLCDYLNLDPGKYLIKKYNLKFTQKWLHQQTA